MACGAWDPTLRNDSAQMYLTTFWTAISGQGDASTCHCNDSFFRFVTNLRSEELLFAWTDANYDGPPITGGITSYSAAFRLDLTGLSPSLWNFDASAPENSELCTSWADVPVSCVYGIKCPCVLDIGLIERER